MLRNCLKKGFRPAAVLVAAVPFVTQVGREFGVRNLSCPAKVMTASELPDMGSYHCVYTYGANDANLRNVTLVVADGNKVGLYDADGKALE